MKKTIIALMALAGIACGANTIDAAFTTVPTTENNFWSDDYVFTFTLAEEYDIATSGAVLGAYWGTQKNNNGDDPGLSANAIYLTENNGALTLNLGDGRLSSILGDTGTLDYTISFTNGRGTSFSDVTIQKGVTYTLSVGGASQSMTPTLTWDGGSATAAAYNGNMNGYTDTMNYGVSSGISTVPEPTTATLSLLALAGLAARRRRK